MQNESNTPPTPWQMIAALNQYVQRMQCQLNDQQAVIQKLCRQLDAMNERLNAAEKKPYYHVDTIQYHFDQLKVEKLDGTLNIGMSAPSEEQVKEIGQLVMPGKGDYTVVNEAKQPAEMDTDPQSSQKPNQFPSPASMGMPSAVMPPAPYPDILRAVDCYLEQNAPMRLRQLEAETGVQLDPYHERLVIADIRKQMSARIQFYMQSLSKKTESTKDEVTDQQPVSLQDEVIRKTTRDIDTALQSYLNRLQSKP
ncbi:spore germination protein GerPC [Paenibacillus sp. R14(2021)]|uniref:spore germination protein GerPC n=1 Tax=Paenibacillus sp. R14(2021) TaxID=2859228 RepID=UPI001C61622A|nr:spore germination protein GerPC [Paenibacillus sp. R14(2021)]